MIALGAAPTALVSRYYAILPQRLVIQWDAFGNITVIGTRSATVLMIANVAAVVALSAIALSLWQNRAMLELGVRRAFLGLNLAQIVAINLVCAMLVSDALGLQLKIKPMVSPAMAVVLFAAGVLSWRIDRNQRSAVARAAAFVLVGAAIVLLVLSAAAANAVVGYFASALAVLAMVAVALPEGK
jgi:hypothetical protein